MQVLENPADVRLGLIFLRVLHGWNQTDLAERAGINKSLISLYELEKQVPSGKSFSPAPLRLPHPGLDVRDGPRLSGSCARW